MRIDYQIELSKKSILDISRQVNVSATGRLKGKEGGEVKEDIYFERGNVSKVNPD